MICFCFHFFPFSLICRSTPMEWRARCLLVELGYKRIFIRVYKCWTFHENARPRYDCIGSRRFFGDCATIYRWYLMGTFRNFTKRFVHKTHSHTLLLLLPLSKFFRCNIHAVLLSMSMNHSEIEWLQTIILYTLNTNDWTIESMSSLPSITLMPI